jgi:hypothetical protein
MAKKQEDKIEKLNAKYEYKGDGELICDISSSEPLKETFVCEKCGKEYKSKSGLSKHKCNVKLEETTFNVEKVVENVKEDKTFVTTVETVVETIVELTTKEKYEIMITEGPFILKLNGAVIFDSDIDNIMLLSFTNEFFRIGKKELPYLGLNFKFKK